jgi:hypothetical protein
METSKAFSLNAFDFKKVGINGLLVGLAATLTYVGTHVIELDFGISNMVVIPIVTILLDAAVKWANSNHVQDLPPVPADPVDPA